MFLFAVYSMTLFFVFDLFYTRVFKNDGFLNLSRGGSVLYAAARLVLFVVLPYGGAFLLLGRNSFAIQLAILLLLAGAFVLYELLSAKKRSGDKKDVFSPALTAAALLTIFYLNRYSFLYVNTKRSVLIAGGVGALLGVFMAVAYCGIKEKALQSFPAGGLKNSLMYHFTSGVSALIYGAALGVIALSVL